jgi:hypothetical protein
MPFSRCHPTLPSAPTRPARVACCEQEAELIDITPSVTLDTSRPARIACHQQEVEIVHIAPTQPSAPTRPAKVPVFQESRPAQWHLTWHVFKMTLV